MTTRTSDTKWNAGTSCARFEAASPRSVARRRGLIALAVAVVAAAAVACGGSELDPDAPPLLTLEECDEVGGTPLFDPADERPQAASCPEGLGFLGVFEEPFYGTDGGICCGGPDAAEPEDSADTAEPAGRVSADAEPEEDGAEQEDAAESGVPREP